MIGQQNNTQKFALLFLGSLLTLQAVQGRRFLRGHDANNIPHANCAPIEDTDPQYNTKAFVLLEMNGSPTAPTPTKDDATAISRSFSNTYDSMVSCSQEGALRDAKTAYLVTDAIERHEPDFDVDFPRGDFTWLLEVDLRCNACGDEDWQLFNDTSTNHHHRPSPPNACICPGPNQTDFLQAFQQAFLEVSLFNELSVWNASIVNATQIPLLYPYECDSSRDTTYNYDGVCPGRSERQFDFLFSEAPSQSPTDSPTQFPTDSPTDRPSSKCEPGMVGCPDKHGCIAGAGERYCEARNTCVMWNEPCASDPTPEPTRDPTPEPTKAPSCEPGMVGCNDSNGCNAGAGERYCAATDSCVMWNEDCSSDSGATAPDPVEDPTDAPVAVVTASPTNAPTQAPVEPIVVTAAPTNIPVTNAPTEAPVVVTAAPTNVPITDAPTQAPVEPVTDAPVAATGTDDVPQE